MRAVRLTGSGEIQCTAGELSAEGILCESFHAGAAAAVLQRVMAKRGWTEHEEILRSTSKPQDEAEIVKEADEHCHLGDEVRLLLDGQGVYDIRGSDEQWLRLWVGAGDLVALPARRYHRFLVGNTSVLRYVQPYATRHQLMQLYRASADRTRAF